LIFTPRFLPIFFCHFKQKVLKNAEIGYGFVGFFVDLIGLLFVLNHWYSSLLAFER